MADELYIKVDANDDGTRPLPAGTVTWTSPSIWLTDAQGTGIPSARVNQQCWINVQVDTTTEEFKENAKVQVWVCDYTLGGVGPASVLKSGSAGTSAGRTGTVALVTGAKRVARVRWTPVDADLINTADPNSGHVCAGANVYVAGNAPEGAVMSAGFVDVLKNQHHAQRNLSVVKTAARMFFPTFITNPDPEPREFVLETAWLGPELGMGPVAQETLLTADFVELADAEELERPPLELMAEPWERTRLAAGGTLVLAGVPDRIELRPAQDPLEVAIITSRETGPRVRVEVPPGGRVPVTLAATIQGGDVGDVHAVELTQLDQDGNPSAGARVLVVNAPEWLR